jgi:hypothetical protein
MYDGSVMRSIAVTLHFRLVMVAHGKMLLLHLLLDLLDLAPMLVLTMS